jgi:hypothetical protein
MTKPNDNTETIDFRFVVTGRPDDLKVLTAKWMRSNKTEVVEFLSQAKKSEVVACDGASSNRVHWAKVECMSFFKYLAESFGAQISAETGAIPSVIKPVAFDSPPLPRSTTPIPPEPVAPKKAAEDDDDWGDEDVDEYPIDID